MLGSHTGEGFIIGISDTGIDMKHCHFYDETHSVPYDTVNLDHRKVINVSGRLVSRMLLKNMYDNYF